MLSWHLILYLTVYSLVFVLRIALLFCRSFSIQNTIPKQFSREKSSHTMSNSAGSPDTTITTTEILALIDKDTVALESTYGTASTDGTLPAILVVCDKDQRSLLHWAALRGRREHVEHLLDVVRKHAAAETAAIVNKPDNTGNTPLILAILKGDAEISGWLLAAGADVNVANKQGITPLLYACSKNFEDCVRICLRAGAKLGAHDVYGHTVLHRMAGLGREDLMRLVLDRAAEHGDCVSSLIDAQNCEGDTALHVACEDEQGAVAVLLVQRGASLVLANRKEKTAADVAKPGLLRKLLEEQEKAVQPQRTGE